MEAQLTAANELIASLRFELAATEASLAATEAALAATEASYESFEYLAAKAAMGEIRLRVLSFLVSPNAMPVNLAVLLQSVRDCHFELQKEEYLADYLSSLDTTTAYIASTTKSALTAADTFSIPISSFRRSAMSEPMVIFKWSIEEDRIYDAVCKALFSGVAAGLDDFLQEHVGTLTILRTLLCENDARGYQTSESDAQRLYVLFLHNLVERVKGLTYSAQIASAPLRGEITFSVKGGGLPCTRSLSGKTDVFVIDAFGPTHAGLNVHGRLVFHTEFKRPFDALQNKRSASEKDQLLCENFVIHEMTGHQPVFGVLTDLITLSISTIFQELDAPVHFISSRVTDPRAVILRLLLLLCDADVVLALVPKRGERVAVVDDTDAAVDIDIEAPVAKAAAANEGKEEEEASSGGTAKDPPPQPQNVLLESCIAALYNFKLEEKVREKENETRQNYLWECRRTGFAPLTALEINIRNGGSATNSGGFKAWSGQQQQQRSHVPVPIHVPIFGEEI